MIANTAQIKGALGMAEVVRLLGHEPNRHGRCACPVHGGKDANFGIKGDVGTCFSQCARSWDTVGLVMEVKNLTFPEALEWIASHAGVSVEYADNANREEIMKRSQEEKEANERLYQANEAVLREWKAGKEYAASERYELAGREWKGETIQKFHLCITTDANFLADLAERGILPAQELALLGLVKQSQRAGTNYDFLRARLIFPYLNHLGKIAGFSGRKLPSDTNTETPKYKNSSESPVFQKRRLLYGFWQARRAIIEQEMAIVVEGMADVVTAHDYEICNVVATGGTSLAKEQVQLLKRHTRNVLFFFDGDDAGQKAALAAVEESIAAEMRPKVCFFPEPLEVEGGIKRYDPDNFLRMHGKDAFLALMESSAVDGLIWRAMEEWDKSDIFRQHAAVKVAAGMIASIPDEMIRDFYVREFSKPEYFGKSHKGNLEEAIKEEINRRLAENNKPKLTNEQHADVVKYGLYVKNNQYWKTSGVDSEGSPITNFAIRPVMLVVGSAKSVRLVEITNVYGHKFTANIDSDAFVEMSALKKEVERRGNYLFLETATVQDFIKIKRKLYDEMRTCFPITTMGWHKLGFWAWANGISTVDGQFMSIDEHGVVNWGEHKFFLPAFAQVNEEILADDQDNSYEDQKNFQYIEDAPEMSFFKWSTMMRSVHGENGIIAMAFYMAAMYRDIIYSKFEFFPHLNLFGPPGTGKSFLGWSMSYLFGKARRPFNLHDGTDVGFFRRMAQCRNGLAWYDEYSNAIHPRRAQGLKNAYDGAGREKGVASTDNRTITTQVNSALIISGQDQPTQDIALFTRCISLNFRDTMRGEDAERRATELRTLEQAGIGSKLTSELLKYRKEVEENFDFFYDDARRELANLVKDREVLDRLVNNYAIPLAVTFLLSQKITLGFKLSDLVDALYKNLLMQSESISKEDDLAIFWDIFQYYHEKGDLKHNHDFIVQEATSITIKNPLGKNTDTQEQQFEEKKKVFFLRFTKMYRYYNEQMKKEGRNNVLGQEAVKYYLRGHPGYLGELRAKKFNGNTHPCYAFDMARISFDLPLSIFSDNDD
jgi:DNA primase